jgi:cytochrome c biogenesis protein
MKVLKQVASLRLTFILLLALAVVSILGTIIAQGENPQFYLENYGAPASKALLFLNANDLYNSWVYQGMLFFLGLNLLLCTVNSCNHSLLKNKKKMALFLIHCSILLIFSGSLVSKLKKYSEYLTLLPGQTIELKQTNAKITFDRFNIEYYPKTKQPKSYRSDITIADNKTTGEKQIIRVNHPFKYKGYSFYQSSFEVLADLDLVISHMGHVVWQGNWKQGQFLNLPGDDDFKLEITHFLPDAEINQDGRIILRSNELGNAAILITMYRHDQPVDQEWIFTDQKINDLVAQKIKVFDFKIKRLSLFYATIIQIIKDPGLMFVWLGFLMFFLGITLFLFQKNNIRSV